MSQDMSQNTNKKIPVSVFIITQNEEQHIARVLKSCQEFDEVIVVDSGSTDKTKQIAESLGAKVVHNDWPGYAKQKQYAMSLCKHDWVLNLDADEELTPEFIESIANIITCVDIDYVKCYRKDLFINQFFSDKAHKPNNHRLFKKASAQYRLNDLVHEGPDFTGNEVSLNCAFNHYGYNDINTLSTKLNHYSSLKAKEKFNKKKRSSSLKVVLIGLLEFIKIYFFQRYFLEGSRGYIHSKLYSYYAFLKAAKLYEHHHKRELTLNNSNPDKTPSKLPISGYIICCNEEKYIGNALTSINNFDEIIVVDSGSTDNTVPIAKQFTQHVLHNDWPGYARQKQFALEQCHNDWVYSLDADEELTPELNQFIQNFITQTQYTSLRTLRNDYFMGYPMHQFVKKPHNNRLFMKQHGQYYLSELAHENPKVKGSEFFCKFQFNHFGYNDIELLVTKFNNYSSLKSEERFKAAKRISNFKLLSSSLINFLKFYVFHRYFTMGIRGFVLAVIYAHYSFLKSAKLYELHETQQGNTQND